MQIGDLVRHTEHPDIMGIIVSFHPNVFFDVLVLWNGETITCRTAVEHLEEVCK